VALHSLTSESAISAWITEFGATHSVLDDDAEVVYNQYRGGAGRPWYVVFDTDMTVIYKGVGSSGHTAAKAEVLTLLASK
jgi:hypothetical protein